MTTQTQSIVGGRELDDLLRTLPAKMHKNINRAALRAGAAVYLREVKSRIPVDSGQLQASARITSRAKGDMVSASVKVGNFVAWYAHLVEFGTRPHLITASDEERGRGRGRGRRGTANRVETFASLSTVNRRNAALRFGGVVVQAVQHPGATGQPFMRPAADAGFREAISAVTAKIRERLTKQGLNVPAPLPSDPSE